MLAFITGEISKFLTEFSTGSSTCRSVLMTAAALKVKLNLKPLNLMNKEQMTPEFIKLNPHHTIPTLVDNDFSIWESRAICVYLIEKYGKNDALYPKDPKTRAVINQRIYFDMGTLFKQFYEYFFASYFGKPQDPEDLKKFESSVQLLNDILEKSDYIAGTQKISIADIILFATISTFEVVSFDLSPYPRVEKWVALMKETAPGRELNADGIEKMKEYLAART